MRGTRHATMRQTGRQCSRRTRGQRDDDWRLATGDRRQATLNVHFGHLNGPQLVRAGDCGLLLLLLLFPAGLFITAAYLSSSWSSTCSRRAFDVPPCVSLPPPPTPSIPIMLGVSERVRVCAAGQCSQSSCIASSSLLFCVFDVSACFAFAFYGAKVATCTCISPPAPLAS